MTRIQRKRSLLAASVAAFGMFSLPVMAGVTVTGLGAVSTYWPGALNTGGYVGSVVGSDPVITTEYAPFIIDNPSGTYVNETLGTGKVESQAFTTGASGFKLGAVSFIMTGASNQGNVLSMHLFEMRPTYVPTVAPGYVPATDEVTGTDLFGAGTGLTFNYNGAPSNSVTEFDFSGTDAVSLKPNTCYALEFWNTGATSLFITRTGYNTGYTGGEALSASAAGAQTYNSTVFRGHVGGGVRHLLAAVYAADTKTVVKADFNGGGANQLRPNQSGFQAWNNLPTSGNGATPDPDFGYPTDRVSKAFGSNGVTSGTATMEIKSVDLAYSTTGNSYINDDPRINSHDDGAPADNGDFTTGNLYRDFAFAEQGTTVVNNGTTHRMEITIDGLDANAPYKLTMYSFNHFNPTGVSVFTDVTNDALVYLPNAYTATGTFTAGDGSTGTQYAPAGQTIDGSAATGDPTTNGERSVSFTVTSNAAGRIILDETTVVGISGATEVLPVLNGIEIVNDARVFNGQGGANWNDATNWSSDGVPNGLGQSANFGTNTHPNLTVDQDTVVGRINFSGSSMNIGGSATLILNDASINSTLSFSTSGRTQINVVGNSANQTFSAPLQMMKDTSVFVQNSGQKLTLSHLLPAAVNFNKSGAGTLEVNNLRVNRLSVSTGKVVVTANGTNTGTSSVSGAPTIGAAASMDLNDNDLVVHNATGSVAAAMRASIQKGYNDGSWDGVGGITSSAAAGNSLGTSAIGYADASSVYGIGAGDTATFDGLTVVGTDCLVKYTYYGDSDMTGDVDQSSDLTNYIIGLNTGGSTWYEGDYNYDGVVDQSADLTLYIIGLNGQGGALGGGGGTLGSAVPEPTSLGLIAAAGLGLISRRRRSL